MIDFIPLEYYTKIFYHFMLMITIFIWINSKSVALSDSSNLKQMAYLGAVLLIIIIIYIGLRPISGTYFGDTSTYALTFEKFANGEQMENEKDRGWNLFVKMCSMIMSVHMYFLLCAFLYMSTAYLAFKKIFKEYWFYAFFFFIISFSFWGAGVNGVRSGVSTSIILLAISYREKKAILGLLMLLALSFHVSMLLPILAYFITFKVTDTKKVIYFWFLCIPISLVAGGMFETLFASLGFDDRASAYMTDEFDDAFSSTGFRWDFLLYSSTAVFAGWYFIIRKKFNDAFYNSIFNTFLIANAFWILVIRASFSNRFAYLSWFLMGLVIIYPFLKMKFYHKQHSILGNIILFFYLFTYAMNIILVK